jgi:hypothetical protein
MRIATQLGSFIVNLGLLSRIPRGEERVFQIAKTPVAVLHTPAGDIIATRPAAPHRRYPAMLNDDGEILIGIEDVLAAK